MKTQLLAAILSSVLLTSAGAQQQAKVVGGYGIHQVLYPWQVMLNVNRAGQPRPSLCGATLIAPQWVMTAAHCVLKNGQLSPPDSLQVGYGEVQKSALQLHAIVDGIHVHEEYDSYKTSSPNDIALLHLSLPIQNVTPVALPAQNNRFDRQSGSQLKVMGWGVVAEPRPNEPPRFNDTLQIVALPLLQEQSACGAHFDPQRQLCAGVLTGGQDSCSGDSGGPLFRGGIKDATAVQYGIVSYGNGCARANSAGIYTRVAHFIPWIRQVMGNDAAKLQIIDEPVAVLPPVTQMRKGDRALLIGVDQYYLPGLTLFGPGQDVSAMRRFLIDTLGFTNEQIYTLTGAQATRTNIIKLVQDWLIAQTGKGNRVWLYFSGHGAFLPDDNGDEQRPDAHTGMAMDETILPYDTDLLTFSPSKTNVNIPMTSNHIRDDEINHWLQQLSGRQVNVVFDSCHSGTATRSLTSDNLRSKSGLHALLGMMPNKTATLPKTTPIKPIYPYVYPEQSVINNPLDHVVFWSAVKSSEVAKDAPPGIFTRHFIIGAQGAADLNGDGQVTYLELLDYVRLHTLSFAMTPQLEMNPLRYNDNVLTNQPVTDVSVVDAVDDAISDINPAGLSLEIVNEQGQVITDPPYCAATVCPQYHFRVTARRDGWLLLYFINDNDRSAQLLPHAGYPQYANLLRANEVRDIWINFEVSDPEPGIALAVLLDPAERDNYLRIGREFAERRYFNALMLQEALNRRDDVILENEHSTQASFFKVNLLR